jgi:hypothetical protein
MCLSCRGRYGEAVQGVRAFLDAKPDALVAEVSQASGLSVAMLLDLVAQGSIPPPIGGPDHAACALCEAPIASGRYCTECQRRFRAAAASARRGRARGRSR